jgi:putative membrane protein
LFETVSGWGGMVVILALLAIIIFAVQNLEVIEVSFLSWSMSIPKVMIIVGTYVLGMITGAWFFDFLKLLFKSDRASASS